jgi:hypothetical protein
MDLTQDIIYRGFTLNDADIQSNIIQGNDIGAGIAGCVVDYADYSDVDVVQFMEKRAQGDGMDVGDVFLGSRRIRISGTLYGVSRADLYDRRAALNAALNAPLAQADEPADKGYQPLYFSEPTLNLAAGTGFPEGYISKRILALPRAVSAPIARDSVGGDEEDSLALTWSATFIARDPRIYGEVEQDYELVGAGTHTGDLINRGNYYAPLNMLMVVGSAAGSIEVTAGTTHFTLTVPASTGNRTIRIKGDDRIVTVQEGVLAEATQMGMIAFAGQNTWGLVPPGTSDYTVQYTTVSGLNGSHMWFWEAYA